MYKQIKRWFYIILGIMVVFLGAYFMLQNKYFGETIGGKPVKVYYKRLGITESATEDEIKKAYRKKAL